MLHTTGGRVGPQDCPGPLSSPCPTGPSSAVQSLKLRIIAPTPLKALISPYNSLLLLGPYGSICSFFTGPYKSL